MKNSERFLKVFHDIEDFLRSVANMDNHPPFYQLVDKASESNGAIRAFRKDLKEYADLRNAIIHERSDGHVIAEPNNRAVEHIERIYNVINKPPQVIPQFQKSVGAAEKSDPIGKAVTLMLKQSFSQIPVLDTNAFFGLLTANTIARWLGASVSEEIFSLKDTQIVEVLNFTEDQENYKFVDRNTTLFEVLEYFQNFEERGKRLDALLITHSGKQTEKLIGIITVSDLPTILQLVK